MRFVKALLTALREDAPVNYKAWVFIFAVSGGVLLIAGFMKAHALNWLGSKGFLLMSPGFACTIAAGWFYLIYLKQQ